MYENYHSPQRSPDAPGQASRSKGRSNVHSLCEDALRDALKRRQSKTRRRQIKLPTFKGKGLRPGIDLDNSASLLEVMEDLEK
jgi:hypothetical protein